MKGQAPAWALLKAARDFIAAIPPLALLNAPRRSGRMLVAEIDRFLDNAPSQEVPSDIVEEARDRWRESAAIRIDDDASMRSDAKGLWISAWVLAGPPVQSAGTRQFRQALDSLPLLQREVYILHRVEGRTLDDIAQRLGLTLEDTQAQFFAALRSLHAAIHGDKSWGA